MPSTYFPPSGGGGTVKLTDVAYFDSAGDTSNGDGSLSNPYGPGNGQKAFDAGFRSLVIGPSCDIGGITSTADNITLSLLGLGIGAACGSGINFPGTATGNSPDSGANGGQNEVVILDGILTIGSISCAPPTSYPTDPGYNGGSLTVIGTSNVTVNYISAGGGSAGDDGSTSANGGPGGTVNLIGPFLANNVTTIGGQGTSGSPGSPGTPGTINLKRGVEITNGPTSLTDYSTITAIGVVIFGGFYSTSYP